jgi:hypothetical protein
LPVKVLITAIGITEVNKEPSGFDPLIFVHEAGRSLKVSLSGMRREKLRVPKIENAGLERFEPTLGNMNWE